MSKGQYYLGFDTTFELDEFARPRLRGEGELLKNTILFILFTKPGQYPSIPFVGLDIKNLLYSFYDDINSNDLAAEIRKQCVALGRYFDNGTINIRKIRYRNKPSLMIHIEAPMVITVMEDEIPETDKFQIGITFNELNDLIYNVTEGSAS